MIHVPTPDEFRQIRALEFRRLIEAEGKVAACKLIRPECEVEAQADVIIRSYVSSLFHVRRMAAAGIVLWGERLFNPKPASVQMVWRALEAGVKVIVPGGSSVGKSYTGIAWTLLDWWADPEFTTVKLISTTGGHAKSNTFGTMTMLHREAIVPMPGIVRSESIALFESDKRACISIVRIREGEDNSEVLQGFHPLPRKEAHPIYGDATRVRAVLDEAEGIAGGVWRGCDNMLGSRHGRHSVKVFAFLNPKDISSPVAQRMEPKGGWGEFDVETGVKGKDTWISRKDWTVVRIDPKKTENVVQRKHIYTGLQTYEGYRDYERDQNGNTISYYTFGRGAYPPDGAIATVVPQRVLNQMRGEFVFVGPTINVGASDIAIDGRDKAMFGAGRMGQANAFIRYEYKEDGSVTKHVERFREERTCIQLDQLFALPKGSAKIVGDAIKANCLRLGIAPEWFMLDSTGNGEPVLAYLQIEDVWSPSVKGINFSKAATNIKVLEQDKESPEEIYEGIRTEVWFAVSKLGEAGYLAIAPSVRAEDLERELLGRRYKLRLKEKKGFVVEDKDEYKKRLGNSPDSADTFTIFVHAARVGGSMQGSLTGKSNKKEPEREDPHAPDPINRPEWVHEETEALTSL